MTAGLFGGSLTLGSPSDLERLLSSLPSGVGINQSLLGGFGSAGGANRLNLDVGGDLFSLPSGGTGGLGEVLGVGPFQDLGAFQEYYSGPAEQYFSAAPNLPAPALNEWAGTFGGILLGDLSRFGQAYGEQPISRDAANLAAFVQERNRVLSAAQASGFLNTPAFQEILASGVSPEQALAQIETLSTYQGYLNAIAQRNPEWQEYLPNANNLGQLLQVTDVGGLRNLAGQYGPIIFQAMPHELRMIETILSGQATDEQGNPLFRQNADGQYVDAAGQVVPQYVAGANGQQVLNPALVPIQLPEQDQVPAIGEILNGIATRFDRQQGTSEALETLGGSQEQLLEWLDQFINDPERMALAGELLSRALGEQPTITDEQVERNFQQVDRLLLREFGQQMTQLGGRLGAAGLGGASPFQVSLREQLRARATETRKDALTELQEWQGNVNAQYQALYTEQLIRFGNQDEAIRATITGMLDGVNQQIAAVQLGQEFAPVDLAPLAELIDAFNESVASSQDLIASQNIDLWDIIGETISGLWTVFLPRAATGVAENVFG